MPPTDRILTSDTYETANDRMKRRSEQWLPRSVILAVLIHAALFTLTPTMAVEATGGARDTEMLVLPPTLELPPPPTAIARPATPVAAAIDIPDDVTIDNTTFDTWTPERLAAPPVRAEESDRFERFVPSMVAPRMLNPEEVRRELERRYPSVLRDAGIDGEVDVTLWLDEKGSIVKSAIGRSSGYDAFDAAALQVVSVMRLTPAQNRGIATRVIVTLPVHFVAH
jgi:TonB family protein